VYGGGEEEEEDVEEGEREGLLGSRCEGEEEKGHA